MKDQVRARLAQVSIDDLDAVHDLFLASRELCRGNGLDGKELARRAERALGLAFRAAQERGELLGRGQSYTHEDGSRRKRVKDYIPTSGASSDIYRLVNGVTDEMFDKAIAATRARNSMSNQEVARELVYIKAGMPTPPLPVKPKKVRPTARGRRTIDHMAIQMNAIAMGVCDLEPGEVDAVAMGPVIEQVFEDIGQIRSFLRKVKKWPHD
jgi:hypothetical protein